MLGCLIMYLLNMDALKIGVNLMDDIFDELLQNTKKRDYDDYLKDEFAAEREQVQRGISLEQEIVADFGNFIRSRGKELGLELVTVSQESILAAQKVLYSGKVVAVDGRREKPLDVVSGIFCEVGVASVSYKTMHEPSVTCMSITSHIEDSVTKEEYYENSRKDRVNENDVTNAMIYWELEACIHEAKKSEWVSVERQRNLFFSSRKSHSSKKHHWNR